ncbi:MAG: hypothetical protein FWH59_00755 [Lentimicrobiaceae bacterium]|nr:hypothetical protein [Lentimicrobiaceae bacterium]
MKIKLFLLSFLFLIFGVNGQKQKLDEIFDMGDSDYQQGNTTLYVDHDVSQGNAGTDKAKQDSINQLYQKWKTFFTEKNNTVQQVLTTIEQLDESKTTKAEVKKYKRQIDDCKEDVTDYINNNNDVSWKNFDDLVALYGLFNKNCRNASTTLEDLDEKVKDKKPINKWIIIGGCLLVLMMILPFIIKIIKARKTKKQQQKQAQKQKEEIEKRMLLSNEQNVVTLKE